MLAKPIDVSLFKRFVWLSRVAANSIILAVFFTSFRIESLADCFNEVALHIKKWLAKLILAKLKNSVIIGTVF